MNKQGNIYSKFWFETFLQTIDKEQTEKEVNFLKAALPITKFKKILDCACGPGRHACSLVSAGYDVTGIDTDLDSISFAKNNCRKGTFLQLDMRNINTLDKKFDAVIIMWQSFGNFTPDENIDILGQIAESLEDKGRLVLDIYNKKFYDKHQGTREFSRNNVVIKGSQFLKNNRLFVELDYGEDAVKDKFEWEIYYDYEIEKIVLDYNLSLKTKCTMFEESNSPHEDSPRMQLIFEKNI